MNDLGEFWLLRTEQHLASTDVSLTAKVKRQAVYERLTKVTVARGNFPTV
jgi:hypothetical protein